MEEIAKKQHLPFDWRQIIKMGLKLFDYSRMKAILLKALPSLSKGASFILIGQHNLETLNDPDFKFKDVVSYLNAVEKYQETIDRNWF